MKISFSDLNGLSKNITVHGKTRSRPLRHAAMNTRFEKIGRQIGLSIAGMKPDSSRMAKRKKQLARFEARRMARGLGLQSNPKVIKAIGLGLAGNKKAFDAAWRAAHPGMDEHLSTASVYNILKGIGYHSGKMKKELMAELEIKLITFSHMRSPTGMVGYKTANGTTQHPTGSTNMFGRSGENHGFADRMRRENVLTTAESSTASGFELLDQMAWVSTQQTVNSFMGPAGANNVFTLPSVTTAQETQQGLWRGMSKQDIPDLGGPMSATATQPTTDDWVPTFSLTAPPSPRRGKKFAGDFY